VRGVYASANYFTVLGVRAAAGRVYSTEEDRLGRGAPVIVVSHAFARDRLGGGAAIGRTVTIGRVPYTVIGVLSPAFTGLDLQAADVWIPLGAMPTPSWMRVPWWESPNSYAFRAVQRELPGADRRRADARATLFLRATNREQNPRYPDTLMTATTGGIVEAQGPGKPGQEMVISTRLGGVAVIVLIIACANVMNLLLARALQRRREIAVRLALGISRSRLVRLLLLESLLVAALAAACAVPAAAWGGSLLRSLLLPDITWVQPAVDGRVALFTLGVALLAGLVAGVVPAVQASRPDVTSALKAGAREGRESGSRLRGALVATQAALSVLLLVGAALFVRSLHNVQALDIGYDASRLLFAGERFAEGAAPTAATVNVAMREIAQRLEGRPGIEAVARTFIEPMRGWSFVSFFWGADSSGSLGARLPTLSAVTPGFFRATGIRLLRGTGFTGGDVDGAPPELVLNEAMAALLWPGRDAIGQCVRFDKRGNPCHTVVGIVETVRRDHVIEKESAAQFYVPLGGTLAQGWQGGTLVVRTSPGGAAGAETAVRAELRAAFPAGAPVVTAMTKNLEPEYRPWRLGARLFTAFGLLALLVSLVGIYSTVSYGVSQRTHEFGVRIALGARTADVLRHVVARGLRAVAIGVGLGIGLSLAAGRLIAALLYGVKPGDPLVLVLASAALLAAAVLAALVPAWRAARVDPVAALRAE
jgi:predicted permease